LLDIHEHEVEVFGVFGSTSIMASVRFIPLRAVLSFLQTAPVVVVVVMMLVAPGRSSEY
jgi:hypothetical protein